MRDCNKTNCYEGGKMKILFYINNIGCGGAERVMVNLANSFADIGWDVVLVTSTMEKNEYSLDNRIKRLIILKENENYKFLKKNCILVRRLRAMIKLEKPNISLSFMAEPNIRLILASIGIKTKKIISIRNDPNREYSRKLYAFLARHLYKKADGVVFQTDDAKKWFSLPIQNKSKVIVNAVDPIFFETEYVGGKDIVTLGRLCEQKNQKLLIDAFKKISQKHKDVNLLIYGNGQLREELLSHISKSGLEDRVYLMGQTMEANVVLSKARCFVLSSDYEGMPNALLEALVVGVPSVSVDCPCGGPRAMLENGKNGILVPLKDVDALASSIDLLLSDKEKSEAMGKCAREMSMDYSKDKVFSQWKAFIEQTINS